MNRTGNTFSNDRAIDAPLGRGARLTKEKKDKERLLKQFRENLLILTVRGR